MSEAAERGSEPKEEKMILAHDAVEGYRPAFYIIFAVSCVYLAYILITSL